MIIVNQFISSCFEIQQHSDLNQVCVWFCVESEVEFVLCAFLASCLHFLWVVNSFCWLSEPLPVAFLFLLSALFQPPGLLRWLPQGRWGHSSLLATVPVVRGPFIVLNDACVQLAGEAFHYLGRDKSPWEQRGHWHVCFSAGPAFVLTLSSEPPLYLFTFPSCCWPPPMLLDWWAAPSTILSLLFWICFLLFYTS